MEHEGVPVGIVEGRHVADARVEDVAVELDAPLLEAAFASATSGTRSAIPAVCGPRNSLSDVRRVEEVQE